MIIPEEPCPYCGRMCECDVCDVAVGYQQVGPYHCLDCGASEIGPHDERRELTADEERTGWYAPGSPAGSSANVDADGNIIKWFEADTLYRASLGVEPRYDRSGRFIEKH